MPNTRIEDEVPIGRVIAAWSVHALTACGAVCCLLALRYAADSNWKAMFVWLAVAVIIDAVDGTLARAVRIKETLPNFDGTLLDSIVDYAAYVLVPAFALGRSELVPYGWFVAGTICLASAYQFCQTDAKTSDHFFRGFPSYWNIVLFYLFASRLDPFVNLAILLALVILVFVPLKYVYPSRTPHLRWLTLILTIGWGALVAGMLATFPDTPPGMTAASLVYVGYYVALSIYLSRRGATRRQS